MDGIILLAVMMFSIAVALWRLAYWYRDSMNQHTRAMEAIHEDLVKINQSLRLAQSPKGVQGEE